MAQENVEVVRRALDLLWEAYKSPAAADGLLELCTPVSGWMRRTVFSTPTSTRVQRAYGA